MSYRASKVENQEEGVSATEEGYDRGEDRLRSVPSFLELKRHFGINHKKYQQVLTNSWSS